MIDLHTLNLHAIQSFMLIAEYGSFRRTADETGRSVSVLSARVKELENQLGVRLFERTTRRLSLTAAGAELLEHARLAFAELKIGLQKVEATAQSQSEQVRLGCIPPVFFSALPSALKLFSQSFPDISVSAVELMNDDLIVAIKNGEVEFGVGAKIPSSGCDFETIFNDEVCAVIPDDWDHFPDKEISVAELIRHPILLLRPATLALPVLEREARVQGRPLDLHHHNIQAQSIAGMAAAGHGVGIITGMLIRGAPYKNLRVLRIVDPVIVRKMSVVTKRGITLSRASQVFISKFRSVLAQKT